MELSEITAGMKQVNVKAKVVEISEPREVMTKFGSNATVATVIIEDDSGKMKLSLWNEDIGKVSVGAVVEITNGYVTSFKGENQLNVGRYGQLKVAQ
ncbi:MAG TPA: OB-fold nucleic acid binding domain-containing protein [Candidatus Bathyarchaeia archaeon]|nr:MAG: DNA-binding protein [Candidatus Bathyarchaeota archaeon RBG_16_48_13]HJX23706.1 OB-fold nucleic acid binding domain-containing protein [Candidatus Bathyarchaeia archaeon]